MIGFDRALVRGKLMVIATFNFEKLEIQVFWICRGGYAPFHGNSQ
jgi:hypothetical protein